MASESSAARSKPTVVIVTGMAGSGKTTLLQRLNAYTHEHKVASYFINLDPAVRTLPFGANIDIRDTVNYHEVMEQYKLGPNGGIVTSLNLFATRFDQVLEIVERRAEGLEYIFIDTPGQIEVFTWSASGTIITESLAAELPTMVAYCVDTPRCHNPSTFMSNMLYSCSIMYKTKLPFVLAFSKTDIMSHDFALDWMQSVDSFLEALTLQQEESGSSDSNYMSSLTRSMCLALDEFYSQLNAVGVSAVTGDGVDKLFKAIDAGAEDYATNYRPLLEAKIAARAQAEAERREAEVQRMQADMDDVNEPTS